MLFYNWLMKTLNKDTWLLRSLLKMFSYRHTFVTVFLIVTVGMVSYLPYLIFEDGYSTLLKAGIIVSIWLLYSIVMSLAFELDSYQDHKLGNFSTVILSFFFFSVMSFIWLFVAGLVSFIISWYF